MFLILGISFPLIYRLPGYEKHCSHVPDVRGYISGQQKKQLFPRLHTSYLRAGIAIWRWEVREKDYPCLWLTGEVGRKQAEDPKIWPI